MSFGSFQPLILQMDTDFQEGSFDDFSLSAQSE
jgi:hypothetical protein